MQPLTDGQFEVEDSEILIRLTYLDERETDGSGSAASR
jgi:hypothetical protein